MFDAVRFLTINCRIGGKVGSRQVAGSRAPLPGLPRRLPPRFLLTFGNVPPRRRSNGFQCQLARARTRLLNSRPQVDFAAEPPQTPTVPLCVSLSARAIFRNRLRAIGGLHVQTLSPSDRHRSRLRRIPKVNASSTMRRWLLALALLSALCAADVDPCRRQPFRGRCPSVNGAAPSRSQFVLRYYLRGGECVSYPFGHCAQDDDEPKLFRYKEECEDACLRATVSTTLVPDMEKELMEQTYGTVPAVETTTAEQTYERMPTECQKQRDATDGLIKGGFKPECDEEGAFKTLQCEPGTDSCFCVNAEGIEVANSRSKPGQPKPDCDKINSASQPRTNECVGGAVPGPCASSMARWFYDESEQRCKPFQYSGCGGNGNNYGSETACEKRCVPGLGAAKCLKGAEPLKTASGAPVNCAKTECPTGYKCSVVQRSSVCCPDVEKSPVAASLDLGPATNDVCQLPKERGPCDRYELRFHYDSNLKECKYFFFGGCEGNANNFEHVEDCEKACGHKDGAAKTVPKTSTPATVPQTTVEMQTTITDIQLQESTVAQEASTEATPATTEAVATEQTTQKVTEQPVEETTVPSTEAETTQETTVSDNAVAVETTVAGTTASEAETTASESTSAQETTVSPTAASQETTVTEKTQAAEIASTAEQTSETAAPTTRRSKRLLLLEPRPLDLLLPPLLELPPLDLLLDLLRPPLRELLLALLLESPRPSPLLELLPLGLPPRRALILSL
uniref:Kunitz/Bovine pancreatic trypsin inhibitor domain protein n=1 Tax=Steinernema glaseri TaxID=37863 RepID=A0A1I7YI99_9BILA